VRGVRKEDASSHCRVGAEDLERLVVEVLAQQLSRPELLREGPSGSWSAATWTLAREHIERVVVDRREVQIIRITGLTSRSGVRQWRYTNGFSRHNDPPVGPPDLGRCSGSLQHDFLFLGR
jgi:hypothetical protein